MSWDSILDHVRMGGNLTVHRVSWVSNPNWLHLHADDYTLQLSESSVRLQSAVICSSMWSSRMSVTSSFKISNKGLMDGSWTGVSQASFDRNYLSMKSWDSRGMAPTLHALIFRPAFALGPLCLALAVLLGRQVHFPPSKQKRWDHVHITLGDEEVSLCLNLIIYCCIPFIASSKNMKRLGNPNVRKSENSACLAATTLISIPTGLSVRIGLNFMSNASFKADCWHICMQDSLPQLQIVAYDTSCYLKHLPLFFMLVLFTIGCHKQYFSTRLKYTGVERQNCSKDPDLRYSRKLSYTENGQ